MSLEGQIHIRLDPGSGESVELSSSRPQQVTQLLLGLEPEALLQKIPMLYALCGKAQRLAATHALQAATVDQPLSGSVGVTIVQQRSVVIEALQEYLWRFMIDLPQRLHKQPALSVFAPLRKTLNRLVTDPSDRDEVPYLLDKVDNAIQTALLGMPAQQWLAQNIAGFDNWLDQYPVELPIGLRELRKKLQSAPEIATRTLRLPDPPTPELLQRLGAALGADSAFAFAPSWHGNQPETGAWSYQQHNPWLQSLQQRGESPLLLRMLARLFEVLRLAGWLRQSLLDQRLPETSQHEAWEKQLSGAVSLAPGVGLGWVRTARGLLLHRLRLDQGKITEYQILAPTEWNFHPQGPLMTGLEDWLAVPQQQLSDWIGLQVLSLDPCVQYQFEVKS